MWDERYAEPGFAYGEEPNDFIAERASGIPPGRVLCLAEGQGRNAVHLATLGYDVEAVDASSVGMARARELAETRGVRIDTIVADLATFAIEPGRYAGVVAVFAHLPAELRRDVHRRAARGLAPGGRFILEAYRKEQLALRTGGPPVEALLYTLEEVVEDLAGELELVHAAEVDREIHEGRYHRGPSAVVQIIGVRRSR